MTTTPSREPEGTRAAPPAPPHPDAAGPLPAASRMDRRVLVATAIGTAVEFYDFGVYAYLTTVLAVVFFPAGDPTSSLLATLAAFAAAYVLRPFGAVLFGHLGDRWGRRPALVLALLGMATASVAMGVLPPYASFGVGATVLLVAARVVQGLSAGGELGGAAVYVAEYAPPARRGALCSLLNLGLLIGSLGASLAVTVLNALLTDQQMIAWGWRVPFLAALPLAAVGVYIRRRLADSPHLEALERREGDTRPRAPFVTLLAHHRAALLRAFLLSGLVLGGHYFVFAYLQIYLSRLGHVGSLGAALSPTVALAVAAVVLGPFGRLTDRVGRRPLMLAAAVGLLVLPLPLFALLGSSSVAVVVLGAVLLALPVTAALATILSVLAETFPVRLRYSGVAIAFNLAAITFGGTTPLVCTWLIAVTGNQVAPAWFLMAVVLVTSPAVLTLPETRGRPLPA